MTHKVHIVASTTPTGGGRHEFRVVCEKCGLVDKAGSEREALPIARHHREFPHRSRMNGR